jgi:predicted MFS family arabinose efflux permease
MKIFQTFIDFFDSSKSMSMIRLLSFLTVVTGMLLTFAVIGYMTNCLWYSKPIDVNILGFFSMPIITLFAFGLGAKVGQKYGEKSIDTTEFTNKIAEK